MHRGGILAVRTGSGVERAYAQESLESPESQGGWKSAPRERQVMNDRSFIVTPGKEEMLAGVSEWSEWSDLGKWENWRTDLM